MTPLEKLEPTLEHNRETENEHLSPEELRNRMRDPGFLPTEGEITRAFRDPEDKFSEHWSRYTNGGDESFGPIYEFFNEGFVTALADHIAERLTALVDLQKNAVTILEVGAGSGRLSHFLQQKLDQKMLGRVQVLATDSGEWKIPPTFPVEQIDHKEALETYQPTIVIFSWMPRGVDVTPDFRAVGSVKEYVLVGSPVDCGAMWETWGINDYKEDWDTGRKKHTQVKRERYHEIEIPPFEQDGFRFNILDDVHGHQISRLDYPGRYYRRSITAAFTRTSARQDDAESASDIWDRDEYSNSR